MHRYKINHTIFIENTCSSVITHFDLELVSKILLLSMSFLKLIIASNLEIFKSSLLSIALKLLVNSLSQLARRADTFRDTLCSQLLKDY